MKQTSSLTLPAVRVVHLTTVHGRFDTRIFYRQCRSLADAGYDTHLVVADGKGDCTHNKVVVHDVGAVNGRLKRMTVLPLRSLCAVLRLKADICHFHDPELIPIAMWLQLRGVRVVFDSHEDMPRAILSKYWITPWLRHTVAWFVERIETFCAKHFAAIVGATPHITSLFKKHNAQSVTLNNYPLRAELPQSVEYNNDLRDNRTVCYIGGISRHRCIIEMIQALEYVDARLLLAGPFENPALETEVRAMPGWSKVDYLGVVGRDSVLSILAASRAGLVFFQPEPNHIYAKPNKMYEYMAAGLPLLASDFPVWMELLQETRAGLAGNPMDPHSIAQSIAAILNDPLEAAAMGNRGREAVELKYHWEREIPTLIKLYREIMG